MIEKSFSDYIPPRVVDDVTEWITFYSNELGLWHLYANGPIFKKIHTIKVYGGTIYFWEFAALFNAEPYGFRTLRRLSFENSMILSTPEWDLAASFLKRVEFANCIGIANQIITL